jgi:hypothetical protein
VTDRPGPEDAGVHEAAARPGEDAAEEVLDQPGHEEYAGPDDDIPTAYEDESAGEGWFEDDGQSDRSEWRDWDDRVQAAKDEAERTGQPVRLPPSPQGGMIFLNIDDPRIDGYVEPPEPQGLSPEQTRRRQLADRLAGILINSPPGNERTEYALASLSLPAKVRYARAVRTALTAAPNVADRSEPGAVKIQEGVGGVVVRLHGPTWSMVFRYLPYQQPVLFVTDEMPDRARRVDTDDDWQPEIDAAIAAVVRELSRFSLGGDKDVYRPMSAPPDA